MKQNPADQSTLSRPSVRILLPLVLPWFYRYRFRLLLGFVALFGVDFLQLTIPYYLRMGVDALAGGTATGQNLLRIGSWILLTAAVIVGLRFCWRTLIIGFSRHLEQHLRNQLFDHILVMDRSFFDTHTTGDLMAHATNDLSAVQMACGMGMVAAADALVMSTAALFFMAKISLSLTVIALLPMPLLAICAKKLSGKLHRRFDHVQEQFSLLTEFARNTMVSIRLIKAYTRERQQRKTFAQLGNEYRRANIRVAVIQGLLFPVATLVGNTGMLLILYFGGSLVIKGAITLGDYVAFVAYMYMLIWPMMAVGWVTNLVQRGLTSLGRIHRLLAAVPLISTPDTGANEPPLNQSHLHFCHLSFTYPGTKRRVLHEINLNITPGVLGITGSTGAGKTTLCRIITRQYPVSSGMLYFAGHDVTVLSAASIRKQISYVSQQPVLFSGTVAENIAFVNPLASPDDIVKAARLAAIDTEISAMSEGYQTVIGERGIRLSGGQKQRIAIARALLAKRMILIIDDALSALDVETEQQVFAGIRTQMENSIVLIVSHRIKLLSQTDQIIIMDQGRIAGRGDHRQLLKHNAFYQSMAEKQQRRERA